MKKQKKQVKFPEPSKIAPDDRIMQADAARILECSRQRISERVKNGSLKYAVAVDPLGNETKFVSLKQVNSLKEVLDSPEVQPDNVA